MPKPQKKAPLEITQQFAPRTLGMRAARRRFAKDRAAHVANAAQGFKSWARKTYGAQAVRGKLLQIVQSA